MPHFFYFSWVDEWVQSLLERFFKWLARLAKIWSGLFLFFISPRTRSKATSKSSPIIFPGLRWKCSIISFPFIARSFALNCPSSCSSSRRSFLRYRESLRSLAFWRGLYIPILSAILMSRRLFTLSNPASERSFLSLLARFWGFQRRISQGVWCSLIYRWISSISLWENQSFLKSSSASTAELNLWLSGPARRVLISSFERFFPYSAYWPTFPTSW